MADDDTATPAAMDGPVEDIQRSQGIYEHPIGARNCNTRVAGEEEACSGCREAEEVHDGRYNWCRGHTTRKDFRDDSLGIDDHEAVAEPELAAADGKALEEA